MGGSRRGTQNKTKERREKTNRAGGRRSVNSRRRFGANAFKGFAVAAPASPPPREEETVQNRRGPYGPIAASRRLPGGGRKTRPSQRQAPQGFGALSWALQGRSPTGKGDVSSLITPPNFAFLGKLIDEGEVITAQRSLGFTPPTRFRVAMGGRKKTILPPAFLK